MAGEVFLAGREVGGRVQGMGRDPSSPAVLIRPPQVWGCQCRRTGGWHQMVLVIRTHDPRAGLLLILAVRVHGRKHLSRWSLEQGPGPPGSQSVPPKITSQKPSALRRPQSLCLAPPLSWYRCGGREAEGGGVT